MVQRDRWDTSWGPKNLIFLIRDIDNATKRSGSVLDLLANAAAQTG